MESDATEAVLALHAAKHRFGPLCPHAVLPWAYSITIIEITFIRCYCTVMFTRLHR